MCGPGWNSEMTFGSVIHLVGHSCARIIVGYNHIEEALKRAASEVLTNSPKQKHNVPGWNKDVKSTRLPDEHAYTGLTIIHPKVDLYLTLWKNVKRVQICIKSLLEVSTKVQNWCHGWGFMEQILKKIRQIFRKSMKPWLSSTVEGETGSKAVTVIWRKHFSALLN